MIVVQQANPASDLCAAATILRSFTAPRSIRIRPFTIRHLRPEAITAAGLAISFGVGMTMGAAWGGGWGYGCGWGHNDVNVNINNNFQRNTNVNGGNRVNAQGGNRVNAEGGNSWQHNPQHRGGAPYSDRATANKYGGNARGDSMSTRQANARQNQGQRGSQGAGVSDRSCRWKSPAGRRQRSERRWRQRRQSRCERRNERHEFQSRRRWRGRQSRKSQRPQ